MWFIKGVITFPYKLVQYRICAWKAKTPLEKWKTFYNFIKSFGELLQLEFYTRRPNGPIFYFIAFNGIICYTLLIYTTYFHLNAGEFSKCFQCYSTVGESQQ